MLGIGARHPWLLLALVACSPTSPTSDDGGHTTTTYGGTNASASSDVDDGTSGSPGDVDDGDADSDVDDGDDSEPNETDTTTSGSGPFDIGGLGDLPNGATCTHDQECSSGNCYLVPLLGGQCGECNQDSDCDGGGCTPPNPFEAWGSFCNAGELGGGCESDEACAGGLSCSTVLDLLGVIVVNRCGVCESDAACGDQICASLVDVSEFGGYRDCIDPSSLPQDAYCDLVGNGNDACGSGICSTVDIMGFAEIGACGECNDDSDCEFGTCNLGQFVLDNGTLLGSTCD